MPRREMIVCVAVFNLLMVLAFIFSNMHIWDFINNLASQASHGSGGTTIPIIEINGLQVTGGTVGWTSDGIQIPRPLPAVISNYPFYIFWVVIVGNLVLMALILRKQPTEGKS
jgi:hypothetical protein